MYSLFILKIMSQKRYFLTFGGPLPNYHNAVNRICIEAKNLRVFHEIIGKTDYDLKQDKEFWMLHGNFLENNKRGFGFWLWKSYLVKKQLENMNENDILVYCDSGCHLNPNGLLRLIEYFKMVNTSDLGNISFQMENNLENTWTKMDTITELDGIDVMNSGQLIATSFILKKCNHTIDLVNKWYNFCCNYHLIDDTPSINKNHSNFKDHRHDQSIFSIIRKKYGTIILNDETYFINWQKDGIKFPIWAIRYRNG